MVCRKIKRNTNRQGNYVFQYACELAHFRKQRSAMNRRTPNHVLKQARRLLIEEDWSPQQISGWLLENKQIRISHERIYQEIRADRSGLLREHTRHKMKYRHHSFRRKPTKVRNIPNRISIHDRPAEADGTRFGDWELDLIVGKGQRSALVTLTERMINYTLMESSQTNVLRQWRIQSGKCSCHLSVKPSKPSPLTTAPSLCCTSNLPD